MSWYRSYYIGELRDGKIYPIQCFDEKGHFFPVFTRSRSFSSDLYQDFSEVPEDKISDELKAAFSNEIPNAYFKWMDADDLGSSDYIKHGYFLINDVERYEKTGDSDDLFYEQMEPSVYALKMKNELAFGVPKPEVDEEGNEFEVHSCADYAYYSYPDYHCREYEINMLKQAICMYNEESSRGIGSYNSKIHYVILLSEG